MLAWLGYLAITVLVFLRSHWVVALALIWMAYQYHRFWLRVRSAERLIQQDCDALSACRRAMRVSSSDMASLSEEDYRDLLLESRAGEEVSRTAINQHWECRDLLLGSRAGTFLHLGLVGIWAVRHMAAPDLLASLEVSRRNAGDPLDSERGAPNRFLLYGLAGTVLGLTGVVASLNLDATDPVATLEGLRAHLLPNMRTAFLCTLGGIFFSLSAQRRLSGALRRLEESRADTAVFLLHQFAPRAMAQGLEVQMGRLVDQVSQSQSFLEAMRAVMEDSSRRFQSVLERVGAETQRSLGDSQAAFKQMRAQLATATDGIRHASTTLTQTTAQITQSAHALNEQHQRLAGAYDQLREGFSQLLTTVSRRIDEQLAAIKELQQHFGEDGLALRRRLDAIVDLLRESSEDFVEARQEYRKQSFDSLDQIRAGFELEREQMAELLEKHKNQMGEVEARLRDHTAELRELAQSLDPRRLPVDEWVPVRESLGALAEQLRQVRYAGSRLMELQSKTQEALAQAWEELEDRMTKRHAQLGAEWVEALRHEQQALGSRVAALAASVRGLGEVMMASTASRLPASPLEAAPQSSGNGHTDSQAADSSDSRPPDSDPLFVENEHFTT